MNAEEHNIALAIYMQWGPEARVPFRKRLTKRLPHLSETEIHSLEQWSKHLYSRALVLVEPVYFEKATREAALAQLQDEFKIISEENLSSLFNQGMYVAWHG